MSAISRTVASVTLPEASSFALAPCDAIALYGFAHVIERELIEHDDVGAGVERLVEFTERFHFDLDRDARAKFDAPWRWRRRWSRRR